MTIWTVETDGHALIAFPADTRAEAEDDIAPNSERVADLTVFERPDGTPLWDGESPLSLREAEAEEQAAWDSTVASAVLAGEIESREEAIEHGYGVFLVPCIDPADDEATRTEGKA